MFDNLNPINKAFDTARALIDDLHTSDEEKGKLRLQMYELQSGQLQAALRHEQQRLEQKAAIIMAEANGKSTLQRSWRPITMLTFLFLVVMDSFGWLASPLSPEAWVLLKLGLGGYVVGRTVEKVVETGVQNPFKRGKDDV